MDFNNNRKLLALWLTVLALSQTVNILSFSRSNWVGLITGLGAITVYELRHRQYLNLGRALALFITSVLAGALIMTIVVKFPWPQPIGGFSTADLLTKRTGELATEAGAASRWSSFPILIDSIVKTPIWGQGFGATITYRTADPRIISSSPQGIYTTYALEWGWLDIALKIGMAGLLFYLLFLFKLFHNGFKTKSSAIDESIINRALSFSLLALCAVHFFSPYLNHPLGLGFVLLIMVWQNNPTDSELLTR
jgi:hypothetical protein